MDFGVILSFTGGEKYLDRSKWPIGKSGGAKTEKIAALQARTTFRVREMYLAISRFFLWDLSGDENDGGEFIKFGEGGEEG